MRSFSLFVAMFGVASAAPKGGPGTKKSGNMNGHYAVSSGANIGVDWNDDYASKGYEYFDVWAPEIATHYGQVFWTDQGSTPIPPDVVKRFDGKVMAIMGYEQDQVIVTPLGKPGQSPEKDASVPINWAYNHHYMAWMTGKHSHMEEAPVAGDHYGSGAHGKETEMRAVDNADQSGRIFKDVAGASQMFSEGNGGESRKSLHGYPAGHAQLIESPTSWHITPMQIDTRNRDHGVTAADVTKCTDMSKCRGFEPRQARYGRHNPSPWDPTAPPTMAHSFEDHYSGILECPCNGRFGGDDIFYANVTTAMGEHGGTKVISNKDMTIPAGTCATAKAQDFKAAADCYAAIDAIGAGAAKVTNATGSDATRPSGCSLIKATDGTATAYYNTAAKGAPCATAGKKVASSVSEATAVTLMVELDTGANGTVSITLKGPATAWFGVGFNAVDMANSPYTLVVNTSGVTEHKIGTCGSEAEHCPGKMLAASITLVSNTVVGGVRTVVLTRPAKGASKDHYTFGADSTFNYIVAQGWDQTFAQHKVHDQMTASFMEPVGATCVCNTGLTGELCGNMAGLPNTQPGIPNNSTACSKFAKGCYRHSPTLGNEGEASGDLLAQRNPTCNSAQYVGGLSCCKHGRIMTDTDQPISDVLLRYHMKFRFWYQEYKPAAAPAKASHLDLPRIYFQTEANAGEYDIPPAFWVEGKDPKIAGYPHVGPYPELTPGSSCTGNCPSGDDCACVHTITYNHTVSNIRLIYAGGHCHAPACKGIWLYRNDKGHEMEILCHQAPIYGNGTGINSVSGIYDETGYLSLPPCLWGPDAGLEPSILLPPKTELVSIKQNFNTRMGHYGEMASWQMRGVNV